MKTDRIEILAELLHHWIVENAKPFLYTGYELWCVCFERLDEINGGTFKWELKEKDKLEIVEMALRLAVSWHRIAGDLICGVLNDKKLYNITREKELALKERESLAVSSETVS